MYNIVVGCTFGDEGKGQVTHALCCDAKRKRLKPLVVRFSGGHQAGHTVTTSFGTMHIFSCFGSGTFAEAPTYWTKQCVMDPLQWMREREELDFLGCSIPIQYFDPYVQVTTPFDVMLNSERGKGSTVGKGIWETVQRQREGLALYVKDLAFPQVVKMKLRLIREWAEDRLQFKETYSRFAHVFDNLDSLVHTYCKIFYPNIVLEDTLSKLAWKEKTSVIFEGSQGVLLDPNIGFSHEYTTPLPCCPSWDNLPFFLSDDQLIFNFVYRSYLTRHGKGPVGDSIFKEINNPYETNLNNPFQGEFQTYEFNKELVLYGIDHVKSHFNPEYKVRLIETCCDICAGHDLGIPYNYSIKTCKKNFDSVCK